MLLYLFHALRGAPLVAAAVMLMDLNRFWWRWWEHQDAVKHTLTKIQEEGAKSTPALGDPVWINVRFDVIPAWVDLWAFNVVFPAAIIVGLVLWGYDCQQLVRRKWTEHTGYYPPKKGDVSD